MQLILKGEEKFVLLELSFKKAKILVSSVLLAITRGLG